MRVLAICGSLRAASSNAGLLRVAASVAPRNTGFDFYERLAWLPQFNPDLDEEGATAPPEVAGLRAQAAAADAFVFSTPEYAHGLPGAFKNGLDWLVSSGELVGKPVLLLNASPIGGHHAQSQLAETVRMIGATVLPESRLEPFVPSKLGADGSGANDETMLILQSAMAALAKAVDDGVP